MLHWCVHCPKFSTQLVMGSRGHRQGLLPRQMGSPQSGQVAEQPQKDKGFMRDILWVLILSSSRSGLEPIVQKTTAPQGPPPCPARFCVPTTGGQRRQKWLPDVDGA